MNNKYTKISRNKFFAAVADGCQLVGAFWNRDKEEIDANLEVVAGEDYSYPIRRPEQHSNSISFRYIDDIGESRVSWLHWDTGDTCYSYKDLVFVVTLYGPVVVYKVAKQTK